MSQSGARGASANIEIRMVADVGGTNTRLALFDPSNNTFRHTKSYINREHDSFAAVIEGWRDTLPEAFPRSACLAIAAVPHDDHVAMLNMSWSFSKKESMAAFEFEKVLWLNDFAANAHALPYLAEHDVEQLYEGRPSLARNEKLAVMGPGTGLGGATIEIAKATNRTCACEPGHMGLSPGSKLESLLFAELLKQHSHLYTELLLSGPGLLRLYQTLGIIFNQACPAVSPAQVSRGAIDQSDKLAVQALDMFCALLGSTLGDFALATGSYGGVYLCGGIVPRILSSLKASDFYPRFCQRGAMSHHMESIPIFAITHSHPGLLGAAHAGLQPTD
jgi:glucokinase